MVVQNREGLFGWGKNLWVGHFHDFLGGALNPGPNYGHWAIGFHHTIGLVKNKS